MRTMLACLAVTVLVALAKTITGTDGPDSLDGTPNADEIFGRDGNDDIDGRNGDDCERVELVGGSA